MRQFNLSTFQTRQRRERGSRWSLRGAAALIALGLAAPAMGGDLNPPPTGVGPTMKTLDEVEPRIPVNDENTPGGASFRFVISEPGSYYLTEDVLAAGGQGGILIDEPLVTLDLMGYTISGGVDGKGIQIHPGLEHVTVRDGRIVGFASGVFADSVVHIQSIVSIAAADDAFTVLAGGEVERCTAIDAGDIGFLTGTAAGRVVLRSCQAINSTTVGFQPVGSLLIDCVSRDNGDKGYLLSGGSTALNCQAMFNTTTGFVFHDSARAVRCAAVGNGADGFRMFSTGGPSVIEGCLSQANSSDGYQLDSATRLIDSTASENGGAGVHVPVGGAGEGAEIRGCRAVDNVSIGFLINKSRCDVLGNTSEGNARGFLIGGDADQCRVDGNYSTHNDVAEFDIRGTDNLVVRNSAAGMVNTNGFSIVHVSSNSVGPIVSGRAGTLSTQSPWANFDLTKFIVE